MLNDRPPRLIHIVLDRDDFKNLVRGKIVVFGDMEIPERYTEPMVRIMLKDIGYKVMRDDIYQIAIENKGNNGAAADKEIQKHNMAAHVRRSMKR